MISLQNINKSYNKGTIKAVADFSLEVEKGNLFGLIGPDGAGKTSLFRILTTLLLPDSGSATVNGWDCQRDYALIRSNIGYMPGRFSLYKDLSVEENLSFFATLFGTSIEKNYELVKDIYEQLEPFKTRRAGQLSGGMKQKLALCCALIHRPLVLFLDEPTTGVDAVSRKEFWDMLRRLQAKEITIMVSTPYMDEASRCDRIALMQNGKLLQVDSPDNINRSYPFTLYAIRSENVFELLAICRAYSGINSCFAFGEAVHLTLKDNSAESVAAFRNYLVQVGQPAAPEPIKAGIEDVFIQLLNQTNA